MAKESRQFLMTTMTMMRAAPQRWRERKRRTSQAIRICGCSTSSSRDALLLCKLPHLFANKPYSYLFLPIVFPPILVYILVMLLSAIDFWVVKNIVGRKLVKMRWWFIIDNEGNERWWYESRTDVTLLFQDRMVFWGTLWGTPAVWGIFSVMNALTFSIFKTATTGVCMLIAIV